MTSRRFLLIILMSTSSNLVGVSTDPTYSPSIPITVISLTLRCGNPLPRISFIRKYGVKSIPLKNKSSPPKYPFHSFVTVNFLFNRLPNNLTYLSAVHVNVTCFNLNNLPCSLSSINYSTSAGHVCRWPSATRINHSQTYCLFRCRRNHLHVLSHCIQGIINRVGVLLYSFSNPFRNPFSDFITHNTRR